MALSHGMQFSRTPHALSSTSVASSAAQHVSAKRLEEHFWGTVLLARFLARA
jgi:hypothetical protein